MVTQDKRLLKIDSTLGTDVLLLEHFEMDEAISSPFSIRADVLTELTKAPAVTAKALIGKPAVITIELPGDKKRYFHGMVRSLVQSGRGLKERFVHFQLEIVPRLARLRERTDCRIFQDKTVPDIVAKVLDDQGILFKDVLTKTYTKRDYVVQYRETDLDFISRLLEEEGIHYFFEHKFDKHTMFLADAKSANPPCPEEAKANYEDEGGGGDPIDAVQKWMVTEKLSPGLSTLRDHHFQLPDKKLEVSEPTSPPNKIGDNANLEIYDYPGGYARLFKNPDSRLGSVETEGVEVVKKRMEEEETSFTEVRGEATMASFVSGYRFKLEKHFRADYNIDWLLTSIQHSASQSPSYVTEEDVPSPYSNSLTAIPHKVRFVPPQVTEKAVINGPQTAVVTGPSGEEIFPDKYGRIKVQFHWDRLGNKDDKSSCWIRVAQPWAGKNWGMIAIPRIGQEVVVQFLEGDPDRPIIIGSVYNKDQMPPYGLPDNKTQTGIKSRSSLGGGTSNFNEIRFEDKMGEEEVYIHAERNLTTLVEKDEEREVQENRKTTIQKLDELFVKEDNLEITVESGSRISKINTGNDELTVNTGNATRDVPAGNYEVNALTVAITADTSLTLTCGGSKIEMTPMSITIQSPLVKIN